MAQRQVEDPAALKVEVFDGNKWQPERPAIDAGAKG